MCWSAGRTAFARVSAGFPEALRQSTLFKTAEEALHKPLPGFELTGESFKSRDAHANLQVTFMRDKGNGTLAADIDVDESSGIKHRFEVIHNAAFRGYLRLCQAYKAVTKGFDP